MKKYTSSPEPLESRIAPATFIVSSTADSGAGSFRKAITDATASPGADVITFNFAVGSFPVISPLTALPIIQGDLSIDASLAVGALPEVVLDGALITATADGLSINGNNVTIKGLVICNFTGHGIRVLGSNNVIANNYIGTDVTGTADVGNGGAGVYVAGGTANVIGSATAGNLISGNTGSGIQLTGGSTAATVIGNKIGVSSGTPVAIPNFNGILINGDSAANLIGGSATGEGNLISGNLNYGIHVSTTASGSTSAPSQFIRGNFIGTGLDGLGDVGNVKSGIFLQSSQAVRVGGTATGERNIISGNNTHGVEIDSGSRHQLYGNWIGIDSTGNAALGNTLSGVYVGGSNLNLIGTQTATARNVISGNGANGVHLVSGGDSTTILGNLIGTNSAGTAAIGNVGDGVRLQFVKEATIGGGGTNAGNVISGNGGDGIYVTGTSTTYVASLKQNNIGTNLAGTAAIGNAGNGIQFANVTGSATIGSAGSGNIIAGNGLSGILIGTANATVIQGNTIGKSGQANARGILINASTGSGMTIGGITAGQGNNIGFNTGAGVAVSGTGNASIRGNNIHDNGGIGIDLGNNGATANDGNDSDSGGNGLLNFPVLFSAAATGSGTVVSGRYTGLANTALTIDFYSNTATGQAETYLGSVDVTTNGSGVADFAQSLAVIPVGRTVSATTNITASPAQTSEISAKLAQLPSISISDVTAAEGNSGTTNFTFTLNLGVAAAANVTVDFATANGTATAGSDFVANSGTVTFTPGQTSRTVTVAVNGDITSEAAETFFVNLTNAVGAVITDAQGLGTISNDDSSATTISINDATVTEGNAGTTNMTFTVTLSAASASAVTVDFATASGTAVSPSDYATGSGTLTFAAGEVTKTITVAVNGDLLVESAETLFVNLTNPTGATISDAQGIGTITNDDAAAISISDATVAEGNAGTTNMTFTVVLSAASASAVTVDFATASGTAVSPSDYAASSGTLTFAAGQLTKTITIAVNGDLLAEAAETLFVNLTNPAGATIADAQGIGTITNDDSATISINDVSIAEGNSGITNLVFTVSLSAASDIPVSVDYSSTDGTAFAGSDYVATAGTLTFAAGQTSRTVTVPLLAETAIELDETLFLNLANALSATISDAQGIGTVANDDFPLMAIADGALNESDSGQFNGFLVVTLSAPSPVDVVVNYSTSEEPAGGGIAPRSGSLTIPAGETSGLIEVGGTGDLIPELTEQFFVILSDPIGATLANSQAKVTVLDNDTAKLVISDVTIVEGNAGTLNAVFTVSQSVAAAFPISVDFSTANGTAIAGEDYVASSGTLSFASGESSRTISVPINGDFSLENAETFFVNLTNAIGASITDAQGFGTISNDDFPTLSIASVSALEGNTGSTAFSFVVSLSGAAPFPVSVDFSSAGMTATAGVDFGAASGTLNFAAGETSKTITILVSGESLVESDETFSVTLSNPVSATIANGVGTGTIGNEDSTTLYSIGHVVIDEGNSGISNAEFVFVLTAPSATDVTFDYSTSTFEGGASEGSDFETTAGHATIPAGSTRIALNVPIYGDTLLSINEAFQFNITNVVGAESGVDLVFGVIQNDDAFVTLTLTDGAQTEGDSGTTALTFSAILSGGFENDVSIPYATADGTAIAGTDYDATYGLLTISAGQTSATITVLVRGDTTDEPIETFTLALGTATGALGGFSIVRDTATGSISDDDTSLGITGGSFGEGNISGGEYSFTVTLSSPAEIPVTVDFATRGGSATSGVDFAAQSGTLTFAPGQTTLTRTFAFNGDTTQEQTESFFVDLSNATVQIKTARAQVTIVDDDSPLVSIATVSAIPVLEDGAEDAGRVPFKITLSKAPTFAVTVRLQTVSGTAGADDYTALDQLVTFAVGQTEYVGQVALKSDRFAEADETFSLRLSNPTDATLGLTEATVTIRDNDGLIISKNKKTATWRDLDGDLVTLKVTKPVLTPDLFQFRFGGPIGTSPQFAGQLLESFDIANAGHPAEKTSITIIAKKKDGLGDKRVNVGRIDADGIRLNAVKVAGDLGKIVVGIDPADLIPPGSIGIFDPIPLPTPVVLPPSGVGVKTLSLGSLGHFGASTQAAGGDLKSKIWGRFDSIKIAGDVNGATLSNTAGSGRSLRIGGDLAGEDGTGIFALAKSIFIGGSVRGAAPDDKVALGGGEKTIRGDVENAKILGGEILRVLGDWTASNFTTAGRVASIVVAGGVYGTEESGDLFRFEAESIAKMTVAGENVLLTRGMDLVELSNDVIVRETGGA